MKDLILFTIFVGVYVLIIYIFDVKPKKRIIMDKKTLSIVSYITIIGWLIAYFSNSEKTSLAKYHLKQSFGLFLTTVVVGVVLTIILSIIPIPFVDNIYSLGILVLIIIGILNASKEEEKPLPIIGTMFENKFDFIQ